MPSLHELQSEFMRQLFTLEPMPVPGLFRRGRIAPERGFAAYRDNVFGNLRQALRCIYPVIETLVGGDFFRFAADAYIHRHASHSGDLNRYGGEFSAFLRQFQPAKTLPYLADVAALEWACHVTHDAADAAPCGADGLASTSPRDYGRLICRLQPSARLIRSPYPILAIWEMNRPSYTGDPNVDLNQGGDALLIRRTTDGGIDVALLPAADWIFLHLLSQDCCLQDAYHQALDVDAAFDLAAILLEYCGNGLLVNFFLPASNTPE
jgi:hypothetical protein